MPPLPRTSVDYAAIQLFTRWAFDVEGTRQKVADATNARLAEVRAQSQRAEREAAELRSQQARVERDYRRAALPAEDYARFRAEIASELEAVGAEAERLAAHADEVREAAATLTAEQDVLRRIHDLYSHLTDRMRAAAEASEVDADVGPLRAALGQVFESVVVRWPQVADLDDPTVFEVPGAPGVPHLQPRLRREVFDADAETRQGQWESLRRVALDLGVDPDRRYSAENNSSGSGVAE
jgi:signal transduction histidine kinase